MSQWSEKIPEKNSSLITVYPFNIEITITKFVLNFRNRSRKCILEILTKNLAFNLSGALFFVGLGYSLKWWYKDQLFLALLKQNLPALSGSQQKISWETSEYVLNQIEEQNRQLLKQTFSDKNISTFDAQQIVDSLDRNTSSFFYASLPFSLFPLSEHTSRRVLDSPRPFLCEATPFCSEAPNSFGAFMGTPSGYDALPSSAFRGSETLPQKGSELIEGKSLMSASNIEDLLLTSKMSKKALLASIPLKEKKLKSMHYPLIDRFDFYTNHINIKLKQPWEKHIYQRFIGVFAELAQVKKYKIITNKCTKINSRKTLKETEYTATNENTTPSFLYPSFSWYGKHHASLPIKAPSKPWEVEEFDASPLPKAPKEVMQEKGIRNETSEQIKNLPCKGVTPKEENASKKLLLVQNKSSFPFLPSFPPYTPTGPWVVEEDAKQVPLRGNFDVSPKEGTSSSEKEEGGKTKANIKINKKIESVNRKRFSSYTPWKPLFPETWFKLSARSLFLFNQNLLSSVKGNNVLVGAQQIFDVSSKFPIFLPENYLDILSYLKKPLISRDNLKFPTKLISTNSNSLILDTKLRAVRDFLVINKFLTFNNELNEFDTKKQVTKNLIENNVTIETSSKEDNVPLEQIMDNPLGFLRLWSSEGLSSFGRLSSMLEAKKHFLLKKVKEKFGPNLSTIKKLSYPIELTTTLTGWQPSSDVLFLNSYLDEIPYKLEKSLQPYFPKKDSGILFLSTWSLKAIIPSLALPLKEPHFSNSFFASVPENTGLLTSKICCASKFYRAFTPTFIPQRVCEARVGSPVPSMSSNIKALSFLNQDAPFPPYTPTGPWVVEEDAKQLLQESARARQCPISFGALGSEASNIFDPWGVELEDVKVKKKQPCRGLDTSFSAFNAENSIIEIMDLKEKASWLKQSETSLKQLHLSEIKILLLNELQSVINTLSVTTLDQFFSNEQQLIAKRVSGALMPSFLSLTYPSNSREKLNSKEARNRNQFDLKLKAEVVKDNNKGFGTQQISSAPTMEDNPLLEEKAPSGDLLLMQSKSSSLIRGTLSSAKEEGGKRSRFEFNEISDPLFLLNSLGYTFNNLSPLTNPTILLPTDSNSSSFFHWMRKRLVLPSSLGYGEHSETSELNQPFGSNGVSSFFINTKQKIQFNTSTKIPIDGKEERGISITSYPYEVSVPLPLPQKALDSGAPLLPSEPLWEMKHMHEKEVMQRDARNSILFWARKGGKYASSKINRINFKQKDTTFANLDKLNLVDTIVTFTNKQSRYMSGYVYPDIKSNSLKAHLNEWLFKIFPLTYSTFQAQLKIEKACLIGLEIPITPTTFLSRFIPQRDGAQQVPLRGNFDVSSTIQGSFGGNASASLPIQAPKKFDASLQEGPWGVDAVEEKTALGAYGWSPQVPLSDRKEMQKTNKINSQALFGAMGVMFPLSIKFPFHKFNHYLANFREFSESNQISTDCDSTTHLGSENNVSLSNHVHIGQDQRSKRQELARHKDQKYKNITSVEVFMGSDAQNDDAQLPIKATHQRFAYPDRPWVVEHGMHKKEFDVSPLPKASKEVMQEERKSNSSLMPAPYGKTSPEVALRALGSGGVNKLFSDCGTGNVAYRGIVVQRNKLTKDFQPFKKFLGRSSLWGALLLGPENPLTDHQCHFFGQKQLSTLDTNNFQRDYLRQLGKEILVQSNAKGFAELSKFSSVERTKILSFSKKVNSFFFKKRKYSYMLEPTDQCHLLFKEQMRVTHAKQEDGKKYSPYTNQASNIEDVKSPRSSEETKLGKIKVSAPLIMARFPKEMGIFREKTCFVDQLNFTKKNKVFNFKNDIPWLCEATPFCFLERSDFLHILFYQRTQYSPVNLLFATNALQPSVDIEDLHTSKRPWKVGTRSKSLNGLLKTSLLPQLLSYPYQIIKENISLTPTESSTISFLTPPGLLRLHFSPYRRHTYPAAQGSLPINAPLEPWKVEEFDTSPLSKAPKEVMQEEALVDISDLHTPKGPWKVGTGNKPLICSDVSLPERGYANKTDTITYIEDLLCTRNPLQKSYHYPLFTERACLYTNNIPKLKTNSFPIVNIDIMKRFDVRDWVANYFNNFHWLIQESLTINFWAVLNQWVFLIAILFWIEQIFLDNVFPSLFALEQILLGATGIKIGDRTHVIRISKSETPKFQNLAGIDGLLGELSEFVLFLRGQRRNTFLGYGERFLNKKNSYGVLLTGPPGTGKTFLVRALANEAKVPVLILSASTLTANKVNSNKPSWSIRHAFRRAKQLSPCILFIDEIDALGKSRGKIVTDINEIVVDTNLGFNDLSSFQNSTTKIVGLSSSASPLGVFSYEQFGQNWPSVSHLLLTKWNDPIKSTILQESNEINRNSLCQEKLFSLVQPMLPYRASSVPSKEVMQEGGKMMSTNEGDNGNQTPHIPMGGTTMQRGIQKENHTSLFSGGERSSNLKDGIIQSQTEGRDYNKRKFGPLTQLLVSMDGVSNFSGVLIMGATNRPELLDPALTRPGRFERIIRIDKPSEQNRIEILQLYSHNLGVQHRIPWSYLANRTVGLTTADLAVAMNYSSLKAIIQGSKHTVETIEYGLDSIARF